MVLPYRKIFQQAYEISRNNRFLWIFGLFLVLPNLLNFSGWSSVTETDWISLVTLIFFILVYFRARAGMIFALKRILEKQNSSFKQAVSASRLFYARLLLITVLITLVWIILGIVLALPVVYMANRHHIGQAWILGIFAGAIWIAMFVPTYLAQALAPLFVVMYNFKIRESLDLAFSLVRKFLGSLAVLGLILFLLQILPIVFFSFLAYYTDSLTMRILGAAVIFLIEIVLEVFQQSVWVLAFLELVKPQKFEEEERVAPIPEVI
ncbi:MAG: hypothetical protein ABI643_03610 [Candidatus Doudnabacteria bacterium]